MRDPLPWSSHRRSIDWQMLTEDRCTFQMRGWKWAFPCLITFSHADKLHYNSAHMSGRHWNYSGTTNVNFRVILSLASKIHFRGVLPLCTRQNEKRSGRIRPICARLCFVALHRSQHYSFTFSSRFTFLQGHCYYLQSLYVGQRISHYTVIFFPSVS